MLKNPFSPNDASPGETTSTLNRQLGTPSSLPPLPPSPEHSFLDIVPRPDVDDIVAIVRRQEQTVLQSGADMFLTVRTVSPFQSSSHPTAIHLCVQFLSNSRNIWSLTALYELLYILYVIIPWKKTSEACLFPFHVRPPN